VATNQIASFGMLLKRYREEAGLTQEVLAEQAGLSARGISDLERGVIRFPRPVTFGLLVRALRLPPRERELFECAAQRPAESPGGPGQTETLFASDRQPPLVGRQRELSLLDAHLTAVSPPVLLLAGEPGIGKSRLLQHIAQQAQSRDWQVLVGGCRRRDGEAPYAPLLEALERHIQFGSQAQLRANLQGCAWLVRLLPELADSPIEPLPKWVVSPEQERRLLHQAVGRFLANIARPAGTLVVLDDLQWAGSDAFDLLVSLVRQRTAHFRVVGAFRDTEVTRQHPITAVLAELAEAQLANVVPLRPLAQQDAEVLFRQLCGGQAWADETAAARVVQRVGGVPFFLVSYARSLEVGAGSVPGGKWMPWDLRRSIERRVQALPETGQALVAAAAVLGRVAPRSLLLAVLARPEEETLKALESACDAGLLEEVGQDAYGFVHDVIREVVESALGQARREVLHRRTAAALGGQHRSAPAALLAYHYGCSDMPDRSVPYLEHAGDAAREQAAYDAAEGYYREAVTCLEGLGRMVDAARLREKLGVTLTTTGQYTGALQALEHAATTFRQCGDVGAYARVLALTGHVYAVQGHLQEGVARLQSVVPALTPDKHTQSLGMVYEVLARLFDYQGQFAASLDAATQSAQYARVIGDDGLRAQAEGRRGKALMMLGRDDEAIPALEQAGLLAEETGQLAVYALVSHLLGLIAEERGEFDRAKRYTTNELMVGERLGDPSLVRNALRRLTSQAFHRGDWAEAHIYLNRYQELPEQTPVTGSAAALERGRVLLAEGAWKQATIDLEQCSALTRHIGYRLTDPVTESLLAERDLLEGRPREALARVLPLLDREGLEERLVTTNVLAVLAWTYLELDDLAQAIRTIAEALRRQRAGQYRLYLVVTLRVHALVALRAGDHQAAARALDEGLSLARALPYPHGEGRLLHVYGQLYLERGEHAAARERLEAAHAIFGRLGALRDHERTEQLLKGAHHANSELLDADLR
jgi:tetratricopeptide (TPR) repeat protein/transcriptional regulator with XRE-family HTH domain